MKPSRSISAMLGPFSPLNCSHATDELEQDMTPSALISRLAFDGFDTLFFLIARHIDLLLLCPVRCNCDLESDFLSTAPSSVVQLK
jgi:hypothetical protein